LIVAIGEVVDAAKANRGASDSAKMAIVSLTS